MALDSAILCCELGGNFVQVMRMASNYRQANAAWNILAQQTLMQRIVAPDTNQVAIDVKDDGGYLRTLQRIMGSVPDFFQTRPFAKYTGVF